MSMDIRALVLAMTKHMNPQARQKMLDEMEEWPIVKKQLGLGTYEFDNYRDREFDPPENNSNLDW
jgi:hypothetical protein